MITDAIKLKQYKEHTGKLPSGAHYIKIGNNVADVFSGEGWGVPTRYRLTRAGWVHQHGPRQDVIELNGVK